MPMELYVKRKFVTGCDRLLNFLYFLFVFASRGELESVVSFRKKTTTKTNPIATICRIR